MNRKNRDYQQTPRGIRAKAGVEVPKSGGRVLRGGNIVYDVSSRMEGVSSGGLGLIVQLVKRLKVAERIDERVRVLKRHLPYRESDHVLNLIYNVMSGGVCLQDVKSPRMSAIWRV